MTTRACKRCQRRPGIHRTRRVRTRFDGKELQVVEETALCGSCRSDADAENRAARARRSSNRETPR